MIANVSSVVPAKTSANNILWTQNFNTDVSGIEQLPAHIQHQNNRLEISSDGDKWGQIRLSTL